MVMLGGYSALILISWSLLPHGFSLFLGGGVVGQFTWPTQMPPLIPVTILSLPPSLTGLLMKPPHTKLWPRKIKKPFHQNNRDRKARSRSELVSLVPHLTWRAGTRVMGEHANAGYCDNVLRPVILLCLHPCSASPLRLSLLGWLTGSVDPIHFKAAFPRVHPGDRDLHFVF